MISLLLVRLRQKILQVFLEVQECPFYFGIALAIIPSNIPTCFDTRSSVKLRRHVPQRLQLSAHIRS